MSGDHATLDSLVRLAILAALIAVCGEGAYIGVELHSLGQEVDYMSSYDQTKEVSKSLDKVIAQLGCIADRLGRSRALTRLCQG